jgi:hypothetical protein
MRLAVGTLYSNGRFEEPVILSKHKREAAAATMCARNVAPGIGVSSVWDDVSLVSQGLNTDTAKS